MAICCELQVPVAGFRSDTLTSLPCGAVLIAVILLIMSTLPEYDETSNSAGFMDTFEIFSVIYFTLGACTLFLGRLRD